MHSAKPRRRRTFEPTYERVKSDLGWTAHQLPSGHDVMVDMPDALAELLEASA